MSTSFNAQFDRHSTWRREHALRLGLFGEWLKDHGLLNPAFEERLGLLDAQMRSDKVTVAFVAEFSRGKSELINAIFFAGYGRRIMPASAGRTTMCPAELGFEAGVPPCLRLLPIASRLQPESLAALRKMPEQWTCLDLDVNDGGQLAAALEKIAEVRRVTVDEARALGFWHDEMPDENPLPDAQGLIEVPEWRHALVNIPHPLLRQGLVILDTPGLNAIGAEPELTINLIPQANAVVFILGADTGVTRSDLAIWREHLMTDEAGRDTRMVVLNKIDTLWDALSTAEQVAAQIEQQRVSSAEILDLPEVQVMALSAQKGLVAKVTGDERLLRASRLAEFEQVLGRSVMGERHNILRAAVANTVAELCTEAGRTLQLRRRDLSEQRIELHGLRGKNVSVIRHMRLRVGHEQEEFAASFAKIQAVRSVHLKLMRDIFKMLGATRLRVGMDGLRTALQQPGLKLGIRKTYAETFAQLRGSMTEAQKLADEIQGMLVGSFRQLNAEFGFSLQPPVAPDLAEFQQELDVIERNHLQYLGVANTLRLAQAGFAERLLQALLTRLRTVFESTLSGVERWSKSANAQLDGQVQARRQSFTHRADAITRIEHAAGGLDERIAQIEQEELILRELDVKLIQLTSPLLAVTRDDQDLRQAA